MGSEGNALSMRARAQARVDNPRPTPLSIGPPTRQGLAALHLGLQVQVLRTVQRPLHKSDNRAQELVIGWSAVSYIQLHDIVPWNCVPQVAIPQRDVSKKVVLYEAADCPVTVIARHVTSRLTATVLMYNTAGVPSYMDVG